MTEVSAAPQGGLDTVEPGFAHPQLESQATFRKLLDALSRPGRLIALEGPKPPAGLTPSSAAIALTLFDFDTQIWLPATLGANVRDWLKFLCSSPITADPKAAAFAILNTAKDDVQLGAFFEGDAKYPDRSTTLVLQVEALVGGPTVTLEGPGVNGTIEIAPKGLPSDFWDQWTANGERFQFGVDVFLASEDAVIGLPRTSRVVSTSSN